MLRFVVRRLLLLVPILLGLSILVFLWIRALPGSPATALLGERATAEAIAAINEQYGLEQADPRAVLARTSKTVGAARLRRLGHDAAAGDRRVQAALPGDDRAGARGDVLRDRGRHPARLHRREEATAACSTTSSLVASLLGISIPIFFLAIILKYVFAVKLGWLPDGRPDERPDRHRPPDELLPPRRDPRGQPRGVLGHAQAPDPARDRARLDPARDHRPDHARLGARRPERGLRAHGAREGRRAADRRHDGTSSATRCCRS